MKKNQLLKPSFCPDLDTDSTLTPIDNIGNKKNLLFVKESKNGKEIIIEKLHILGDIQKINLSPDDARMLYHELNKIISKRNRVAVMKLLLKDKEVAKYLGLKIVKKIS